ncbi:MAG: hypothetical protein A3C93_06010 [Candidatus Lloydbacteria bacterium RIFCSPHIGHO2_02_FULL_54_17]|uniref:Uncharacterized protein n=1 Tax=Candidatus Lloydbacteria bacterium RIFCSPHIGHO2_02_FULL_54_17 TaxID=1798664 RepID=A0A1G2DEA0_9BACT|nr:MAG: hypothetical protein A2762_06310 [Candidatus Lloydbacteria bacterium RIFCSPHIGHO2_01_FULL_54_11]OGZ11964.1 MAG: hypothetical protein A3C93_06010 [Candidatus Lloydbacteria bacterium RIFCSPHIGHO2_02_FULL_54_17]OGZ14219.1 MAG: hypothetical protein A2948_02700 [Candidatus Lloydbacteria bacterium RIFCSPLOWO2_01_FULL_54_18]
MVMKRNYVPLTHTITRKELENRQKAHIADLKRIGEFLPEASARRYLEESDNAVDAELKDEVLIPEFSAEELAQMNDEPEMRELRDALLGLAGKTGAQLAAMSPRSEEDYSEDVASVRWYLAQFWLHVLLASHAHHKEDTKENVLHLRADLLPEETEEEIERRGGSHLGYMRRDVGTAGIAYEEQQNACYAEFIEHVKGHLLDNPEGLVLSSYDNIRLFKEGDQFIVR